jgi:hypothetical protein
MTVEALRRHPSAHSRPLEMPLRRHHHVIGPVSPNAFHCTMFWLKAARRVRPPDLPRNSWCPDAQRILLGKIMDGPGGGIGAHGLRVGRIGQIAAGKQGRPQFTRCIDPAKRKAATCRAAMLPDHGSSHAKTRLAPKLLRSPKSPKLDEAPRRAMVPEAEACASSAEA